MNVKKAIEQKKGEITIKGWVYRERTTSNKRFIVVRDTDDIIQCVISEDSPFWDESQKIKIEASVEVTGELVEDQRAPTGVELRVSSIKLIGESNDFPITKDYSKEHLANNRHLWLRSRKMNSMLKIRSTCFDAFREYFKKQGFYEFHSPILQATQCEGGSDLFPVKYFDTELYLSQTWQLYAEAGIFSVEKIFTIGPTFRAEKSKTSRHLTEFWMAEMEMAWCTFEDIQNYAEGVIKYITEQVLLKHHKELELLERDLNELQRVVEKPFARITYTKALERLKNECGMDVPWGKDLRTLEEEKLVSLYDTPVIVTEYPTEVKAFYMKLTDNPKVVQGCDILVPGIGEIIGGSQREEDIEKIKERLIRDGEDPKEYEMYLDTRRYGSVPHGGFGLGMERIIAWLCGFESVKDAIAFPRTPLRYKP